MSMTFLREGKELEGDRNENLRKVVTWQMQC